ncbi:hypothetical protein [Bradyrhizobium sp. 192]|uniref:hypothetical protein n=1 Tax=Bradyrhizobium sp. 192 TaxID=2782660 RepID=UPI001FFE7555|nr:hypothetical protein [Bradyrhizobium sp. 192]UPJ55447.1 hypothetical protein IVB24_22580 [Bradyrhizobium sp. 192]
MSETDAKRDESVGLYVGWDELHRRVAPAMGRDSFRSLVKDKVAKAGFPPFSDTWRGFYWPKVRAWLDSQNEVGTDARVTISAPEVEDGADEGFKHAPPRRKARVQDRPQQPGILAGQPGHTRPHGVSRHLHSVATGRD